MKRATHARTIVRAWRAIQSGGLPLKLNVRRRVSSNVDQHNALYKRAAELMRFTTTMVPMLPPVRLS
jgi:hypothetical protein